MQITPFSYTPADYEAEAASNSYLMSLIAIAAGLPLPIFNLLASFLFYLGNRKKSFFIRWHCTQALVAQLATLVINSFGFWWTVAILLSKKQFTNGYVAYIIVLLVFNLIEFAATVHTAIKIRKGQHVQWWLAGAVTNLLCKK
jgi:hypothetical protein